MTGQWSPELRQAIAGFLQSLADEKLALGHRDSEWLGHAPHIEEDVAWASISQDEIGHAELYLQLLGDLMGVDPDATAFGRMPEAWRSAQLLALPNGDFAHAIARHFLYDQYDAVRLEWLRQSGYQPLAEAAARIAREERYHVVHFSAWLTRLATPASEARQRLIAALGELLPACAGLFERTAEEELLCGAGLLPWVDLQTQWLARVCPVLDGLGLPSPGVLQADGSWQWRGGASHQGGRRGQQTADLQALLDVMCEVYRQDPAAHW